MPYQVFHVAVVLAVGLLTSITPAAMAQGQTFLRDAKGNIIAMVIVDGQGNRSVFIPIKDATGRITWQPAPGQTPNVPSKAPQQTPPSHVTPKGPQPTPPSKPGSPSVTSMLSQKTHPEMGNMFGQVKNIPIINAQSSRSGDAYRKVIEQFDVTNNSFAGRYQRDPSQTDWRGQTRCNIFAGDVMRAMNAPLPTKPADSLGREQTVGATAINSWLKDPKRGGSQEGGWHLSTDLETLLKHVQSGKPALASTPDHVAVIQPNEDLQQLTRKTLPNLMIAQAGAKNFNAGPLATGWPRNRIDQIQFFIHE